MYVHEYQFVDRAEEVLTRLVLSCLEDYQQDPLLPVVTKREIAVRGAKIEIELEAGKTGRGCMLARILLEDLEQADERTVIPLRVLRALRAILGSVDSLL